MSGFILSCANSDSEDVVADETPVEANGQDAILEQFDGAIDLNNLSNYANQPIPDYINEDNTDGNPITDGGAVLGRVLFYDTNLSSDNTVSCSSCHKQEFAFGDDAIASTGVNGTTGRHSIRLVNARFGEEDNFFWDERANTLEDQSTMPIQDHIEMGFSGLDGDPSFTDLIDKLENIEYYQELFTHVYGDANITEERMQNVLAQFVRSIQSFDSRYDAGRAQENGDRGNFNNFTAQENNGKELFMDRPDFNNNGVRIGGGIGCDACHRAPEFDIDDNSDNNGLIGTISGIGTDTEVTRSPSLRELFNAEGISNGPFMHNGFSSDFMDVLDHYDQISTNGNNNLDRRLRPMGNGQNLVMTQAEKEDVIAFIKTLSGTAIYIDEKWSDPFQSE